MCRSIVSSDSVICRYPSRCQITGRIDEIHAAVRTDRQDHGEDKLRQTKTNGDFFGSMNAWACDVFHLGLCLSQMELDVVTS